MRRSWWWVGAVLVVVARVASGADGVLDTSFGGGTGKATVNFGYNDHGNAVAIQPDGKIVVAGFDDGGLPDFAIARFNSDGSLDTSFGSGPDNDGIDGITSFTFGAPVFGGNERAQALALQSDGKIVVAGFANTGGTNDFAVARLDANGGLDGTFNATGKRTIDLFGNDERVTGVAIQPDGKIVLGGSNDGGSSNFSAVRLTATGALDTSFNGTGIFDQTFGAVDFAQALALQPDGKIVLVGYSNNSGTNDVALMRIDPDGTLDSGFGSGGAKLISLGGDERGSAVVLQPDGQIVVAGCAFCDSLSDFMIMRLNGSDGSLDTTFNAPAGSNSYALGMNDFAHGVARQSDGAFVVAGETDFTGNGDVGVVRFKADGTTDSAFGSAGAAVFDIGTSSIDEGNAVAIQPDGAIVVAGTSAGNFAVLRLAIAPTFAPHGAVTAQIGSVMDETMSVIGGSGTIAFAASGLPPGLAMDTNGRITGIPTKIGDFDVMVSATNDAGTATASVPFSITAIPNPTPSETTRDSDGDGFADEIEHLLGTAADDSTVFPFAAGAPQPLTVSSLKIKLVFLTPGKDAVTLTGKLPLPAGFSAAGLQVVTDVGGVVRAFTLDAKGTGAAGNDTFRMKTKGATAKFKMRSILDDDATLLADEGLTNASAKKAVHAVPVVVLFNGGILRADRTVKYTAKAGRSGRAK